MNKSDFLKIIGATEGREADYIPVALLLKNGYACFGHFNAIVNQGLDETLVVINASLMELRETTQRNRPAVEDFREFLLEIVEAYDSENGDQIPTREDLGKQIPLIAIAIDEISILYPLSQIIELLNRVDQQKQRSVPALFDLNRSEILNLLRMKLW